MTRRIHLVAACLVLALAAAGAHGLEGQNGYTATRVLTPGDVRSGSTYASGFSGAAWSSLTYVDFWAPIGPGQREGIAADADGDLFVLVRGRNATDGTGPQYTGLVRYDGTTILTLSQSVMSSGFFATRTGVEMVAVIASPTTHGPLTAGHPVVIEQVITEVDGVRVGTVELVSIDPSDGSRTLLYGLDVDAWPARLAIDGCGGSRDGTLYVGPMADGSILKLTWNAGTGKYDPTTIPGTFEAGSGVLIGPAGELLTFAAGDYWHALNWPYPDQPIYEIDPATGSATTWSAVDGKSFIFDWVLASDGAVLMGLRSTSSSRKQRKRYVAQAPPGGATDVDERISESDHDAWSLAAGPDGGIYVLEQPFSSSGEIWLLTPGSGGGGGKGKGKK